MEIDASRNGKEVTSLTQPGEDETLIDTQFIHWGYLNCCQIVSKGKKVKKEKWSTYWLELCGSTLRFYRDSSLHIESSLSSPPSSPSCILEGNETKVAFFELGNADVKVFSDGKFSQAFHRKSKRSVAPKVFRRHMFQLKLRNLHSTYVFQAPSHSAMLRWVSKIQESLDAIGHVEQSGSAETRLKLVRDIMARRKTKAQKSTVDETDADNALADTVSLLSEVTEVHNLNPTLRNLKNKLALKHEQMWQFEVQMIDFLGRGKGKFKRDESICTIRQDYLLVPGRIETFIPAGTKVTIFGQLPNKRWRCLVERDELMKSLNVLLKNIKENSKPDGIHRKSEENECRVERDLETLENLLVNLPTYPLIGCLPTSLLDVEIDKPDLSLEKEASVLCQNMRDIEIRLSECLTDSDHDTIDGHTDGDKITTGDLNVTALDVTLRHSGSEGSSEAENDFYASNDSHQISDFGAGIIIRKKLRQKGISIIVGSSSSEGEDENEIQRK